MKLRFEDIKCDVAKILRKPNVIGFSNDFRNKIKGGKELPIKSIRFYVTKKLPKDQLKESELIPEYIYDIPTDVVEVGRFRFNDVYTGRYRPIPCGVSEGPATLSIGGTRGWFIIDANGKTYVISCNHVYAGEGDVVEGSYMLQPALIDGGKDPDDRSAILRGYVPLQECTTPDTPEQCPDNYVDVAWCEPIGEYYTSICDIGGLYGKTTVDIGDSVTKVGRTTGKTTGTVEDVSVTMLVEGRKATYKFTDVVLVRSENVIVGAGDSGSPVVKYVDNKPYFAGLLFAGNDNGTMFLFAKADNIEREISNVLGTSVYILSAPSPPPTIQAPTPSPAPPPPSPFQVLMNTLLEVMIYLMIFAVFARMIRNIFVVISL